MPILPVALSVPTSGKRVVNDLSQTLHAFRRSKIVSLPHSMVVANRSLRIGCGGRDLNPHSPGGNHGCPAVGRPPHRWNHERMDAKLARLRPYSRPSR